MIKGFRNKDELLSSSGNPAFDRALISELKAIIAIFPIDPGFKFIRDGSPNAFATEESYVPNTRGTVLLGLNLIKAEMEADQLGGIAVAGICAHECAHIYQFFSKWDGVLAGPSSKWLELHADALAGYYLARRGWSLVRVETFARSLFQKGDYEFNDPGHHGTPGQRVAAVRDGQIAGVRGLSFAQAAESTATYIKTL